MATSEPLRSLAEKIEGTLSPDLNVRREAERFLEQNEKAGGFVSLLLRLVTEHSLPIQIRLGAAIFFKNWAKREWPDADAGVKDNIKQNIVSFMLTCPEAIRKQLSEVLAVALETETRETWPDLLPELGAKLTECITANPPPLGALVSLLDTMDTIFEPYRHRFRTDGFFREIKHALFSVQEPLTAVFQKVSETILTNGFEVGTVGEIFEIDRLCCSVFYSLNWQDIPEYFDDNMHKWVEPFLKLLQYQNPTLEASALDTEASPLDRLHAQVLDNLNLYQSKYEEEFRKYLQESVSISFQLLVRRGEASRFDAVATHGMRFLTTVSRSADFALFAKEDVLASVCQRIVLPNMNLRDEDVEMFEDNPREYMRLDVEGSDAETRRRCAVELVRGLNKNFEGKVTETFSAYVSVLLSQYQANPLQNWKSMDTAIYVVTALGWKSGTQARGATSTSGLVSVVDFFNTNMKPAIESAVANPTALQTPVLTADTLKYVITFRNQLPATDYLMLMSACAKLMTSSVVVVHSYAALTMERLLSVHERGANGSRIPRLSEEAFSALLPEVLPPLFRLVDAGARENEYAMKCVVRVIVTSRASFAPHAETGLRHLCAVGEVVSRNPSNPSFNHYLFEALAALVGAVPTMVESIEAVLVPFLGGILSNDIVEFAPYSLQILAKTMTVHSIRQKPLPDFYRSLAASLLPVNQWDRAGFIPGMTKFLQGYVRLDSANVLQQNQLEPLLCVFQKLVASKANDHWGLSLVRILVEVFDFEQIRTFIVSILKVLMYRLNVAKTTKYTEGLLVFLSAFVMRYGPERLTEGLDELQPSLLCMLLTQVWTKTCLTTSATGPNRKLLSVALTTVVTTELFIMDPYKSIWIEVLEANIALLEGIKIDMVDAVEEEEEDDIGLEGGYNVAYSQLANAKVTWEDDLVKDVEPKAYLASRLHALTELHPNVFRELIQQSLNETAKEALQRYLSDTGHTLR